jgi:sister chromatid cohesion protein PDS5
VCFDVLSGPSKSDTGEELSKNVEHHMTMILEGLIDESQSLPSEVIDTVLAQFLRADPRLATGASTKGKKSAPVGDRQATLLLKEAPPAYNLAKNICNSCADKMARYVTRYFGAVISDAASAVYANSAAPSKKAHRRKNDDSDDEDEVAGQGPSEDDWKEIDKAHSLMRELWRSTPSVLQDIIPSMEGEVQSQNIHLRLLAVETLGDMVAGIGKGGPPPPATLNPAVYPSQSLEPYSGKPQVYNFLTTPTSPVSFISRYPQVYQTFVRRRLDKSGLIRAAWATAVGKIIMTSAGGVGLDGEEQARLLNYLAESLRDVDEKVRYSAVQAVAALDYETIVQRLGSNGGVNDEGSLLSHLAERAKDRKPLVHEEAIPLLGRIWGVAAGAIAEGSERTANLLGPIPSKIFDAYYINSPEISALIDRTLYDSILPLSYPPIKPKPQSNSQSQRIRDSQASAPAEDHLDPDKIRTERALVLIRDLEPKAKAVLFSQAARQTSIAKIMAAFLDKCEQYNGGVMDSDEKEIKNHLTKLIDAFAKILPEPTKASEDLWKFAKMHDRRAYQLIRFGMDPASDYRKVQKAIKELMKRLEDALGAAHSLLETISTLLFRCSILLYNRSHVPAIIEFSRSDEKGLASTAHEVLKEISKNKSEVLKAHIQELCKSLETEAPTAKKPNPPGAVDDLKACAEFARRFPKDVPKDRKFIQALLSFVAHGRPPKAAKYGVFIVLTVADKKQMYAKDIFESCTKNFEYGKGNYLAKLAALGQLVLLGANYIDLKEADTVVEIAIKKVLSNEAANPRPAAGNADPEWDDIPDEHCRAKMLALKVLVNRLRAYDQNESIIEPSEPVFRFLNTLIQKRGQLSKKDSPAAHASRLRLLSAQLILKLCCEPRFNQLLTPTAFNDLATLVQDECSSVRSGFVKKLQKYLGEGKLSKRFYTYLFLLAFEPDDTIKDSAIKWIKSRALAFARAKDTPMEALFARFLSLLAHHPDFEAIPKDDERYITNLQDFAKYIMFYLLCVATADNLPLIYHVAQRVKSVRDGIDPTKSENLYVLSDLAQATIRAFQEQKGWSLPAWPGKAGMPSGIFKAMPDHETAQEVATTQYLPNEMVEAGGGVDDVVREMMRTTRKRKHEGGKEKERKKKAKMASLEPKEKKKREIKTPKKRKTKDTSFPESDSVVPSSERRKSDRKTSRKSYVELSDEDQDEEMRDVEVEDDAEESDGEEQPEEEEDEEEEGEDEEQSGPGAEADEEEEQQAEPEEEPEAETPPNAEPEPLSRTRRGGRAVVTKAEPITKPAKAKANGVTKIMPEPKPRATRSRAAAAEKAKATPNGKATKKKPDVYNISSDLSSDVDMSD